MTTDKPLTSEETLENFIGEILGVCLKPKYSNDVVREGLEFCSDYVREQIDKARRENKKDAQNEIR